MRTTGLIIPTPESPTRPTVRVGGHRKRANSSALWRRVLTTESGSRCRLLLPRTPASRPMRDLACVSDCWNSGAWNRSSGGASCRTSYGVWLADEERLCPAPEGLGDARYGRRRGLWLGEGVRVLGRAARRARRFPNPADDDGLVEVLRRRSSRRPSSILPTSPCPACGEEELGRHGFGTLSPKLELVPAVLIEMDGVGERVSSVRFSSSSTDGIGVSGPVPEGGRIGTRHCCLSVSHRLCR
jgi:hypothetical protein